MVAENQCKITLLPLMHNEEVIINAELLSVVHKIANKEEANKSGLSKHLMQTIANAGPSPSNFIWLIYALLCLEVLISVIFVSSHSVAD